MTLTIDPPPAAAQAQSPQPVYPAHPVSAAQLNGLLARLGVTLDSQALIQAVAQLASSYQPARPVEWVRAVLARAQVSGVVPLQLLWRRFDPGQLPALVWDGEAWFLAERLEEGQAFLRDDAGTEHRVPAEALQDSPVVWLRKQARPLPGAGLAGPAARLVLSEIFREPGWLGRAAVATIVVNLLAVASSMFSMQVYDRVVPTLAYATLTTLVVGMVVVTLFDWLLKIHRARIIDSLSSEVDRRVSQRVFDHLLQVQLDQQPRGVGSLAAQVGGLDSVRQFFSSTVVFGIVDLPFAVFFLVLIGIIGGQVAYVYVVTAVLALALGVFSHLKLKKLVKEQVSRSNERQGVLVDAIRGAEAARAASAGWRFSREWEGITRSIQAYSIQQRAAQNQMSTTAGSLSMLSNVAAVVVGVWEVQAGHLSTGGMIACSILGSRVIGPLSQAVQFLVQWESVTQSLDMVDRVLKLPPERRPEQTLLSPQLPAEELVVELEKVRYAYPESPVMQVNLTDTLRFKAGDRVLLLGPVGGGKSTLLKVLAGLYRPGEGRVRLGDTDLWEIDPQVLASQVAYLPQEVHLFKGTLRSNLTLSGLAADATVSRVARELGVDEIAAGNPMGMDLPISEGGVGLSGGQRQLLALARVVIAQPRVWLLDEPTASLDAEAEGRVWETLARNVGPHDILIVATHKPGVALRLANRVLVMRRGEVVRDGAPQDVLPRAGGVGPAAGRAPVGRPPQGPSVPGLGGMGAGPGRGGLDVV